MKKTKCSLSPSLISTIVYMANAMRKERYNKSVEFKQLFSTIETRDAMGLICGINFYAIQRALSDFKNGDVEECKDKSMTFSQIQTLKKMYSNLRKIKKLKPNEFENYYNKYKTIEIVSYYTGIKMQDIAKAVKRPVPNSVKRDHIKYTFVNTIIN